MTQAFPKRLTTDKTSEIGVNLVSTIINDVYGWVFRKTHLEHDYGVDAYIDFVTDDGFVTGQFIAAQIKTGQSYLSKNGNTHWYIDSKEHLNYYLNLPVPILLIVCDPDKKECFWARLDKNQIDFREKNWRHPIPKNQKLSSTHKNNIIKFFGKMEDHVSDFEQDNELLKMVSNSSFIQYSIQKTDIEKRNIKKLRDFIDRITRNEKLTLAVQGRLYICTYGYEDDIREVHQIKEIRRWVKKARKNINEWYLCTIEEPRLSSLLWIAACSCNIKGNLTEWPDGRVGYLLEGSPKEILEFLEECYIGLNEATEKWGWTKKFNHEISRQLSQILFSDFKYPDFNGNNIMPAHDESPTP